MIWLFKTDEVFWGKIPKVDEHFVFDNIDTEFDISMYDISLYFATANYYLLNESNDKEIYLLQFVQVNANPIRTLVSDKSEIYHIVRNFYIDKKESQK